MSQFPLTTTVEQLLSAPGGRGGGASVVMPIPSVGRIVHLWPDPSMPRLDASQPFAAIITFVHPGERVINVVAFDHTGCPIPYRNVPLLAFGEGMTGAVHATWPGRT